MSSMRNAIQRRVHRERAQPLERKKLGLLEKHKDYSLRAKDHKKKQATLKALKAKAVDRNEDEFYFGMLSQSGGPSSRLSHGKRWTGTVDGDRGNKAMDVDTVRLLKTQDVGYIRTMRSQLAKQADDLRERTIMAGVDPEGADADEGDKVDSKPSRPKKVVFVYEDDEGEAPNADVEMCHVASDEGDAEAVVVDEAAERAKRISDDKAARLLRKLQATRKKVKALTDAEHMLELQRARMAKTATIGGIAKNGKKFKIRARKR